MIFAHAGHWLASVAYAAPVIVLLGWMAIVRLRDRGAAADEQPQA